MEIGSTAREVDFQSRSKPVVVKEKALDLLPFVAKGDTEFPESVSGVVLHDVPDDRVASDLGHGLGRGLRLLGETRTGAASQDHDFHLVRHGTRRVRA